MSLRRAAAWRVGEDRGVAWLLTPAGEPIYACGVNSVNAGSPPEAVEGRPAYHRPRLYPSTAAWAKATRERLDHWGFNHVGAWASDEDELGLPSIPNLDLGRLGRALWFDPFEAGSAIRMKAYAARLTAPHRRLGLRIGYFPDNEVGWWNGALFTFYLAKGWDTHTKRLLWRLLCERYDGQWSRLLDDWVPSGDVRSFETLRAADAVLRLRPGGRGIALVNHFTRLCAERYYRLVYDALRAADPEALIFSDRLPIYYSQDAVLAMRSWVDVIAVNYDLDGPDGWVAPYFFDGLAALAARPVLVSEFFCAAMENRTGNRNTGHLLTVATQVERAAVVERALRNFARFPHVLGTHWFQYHDEPQGGRPGGADYNMGLVDIQDRPYDEVVAAFQRTHRALPALHAGGIRTSPPLADTDPVPILRAPGPIDVTDHSLEDWDQPSARLCGFRAEPPYVPFADVYLTWDPAGLYLATIGMDYMHPDHLAWDDPFPLSEAYQLHLLIAHGGATRHVAIHFLPEDVSVGPEERTNARGSLTLVPRASTSTTGGDLCPRARVRVQHLRAVAPRISGEVHVPPALLGLERLRPGIMLRVNIVVRSHHRAHEMWWAASGPARSSSDPASWRTVLLAERPARGG